MTTVPIPPWNAQGVLPPVWDGGRRAKCDGHRHLRAEAIVLTQLLTEMAEAEARSRDLIRDRLATVARQLARDTLEDTSIAAESTQRTDVSEAAETLVGEFLGVWPHSREFEFRMADGGEVVHGYIGAAVAQPKELHAYLKRTAGIRVVATRVEDGPPCYRLLEVSAWASDAPEAIVPPASRG